ncbi:hypothetical protein [Coxiella-like endosymbiont of Rhipicephalus sanguineus]|uniref:hypothetical protein n=1 Tax=Coxiella-like endosymbiont of Rhipicephalus sanguineus TaxID=1955402 RepID=UPI00203B12B6|nr:hypothetical protein [Coxiella-like endosymbiont of Rhipicephalus sanguineus]
MKKRLQIVQEIRNLEDKKLVASASISITCVDQKTGKAYMPDILKQKLSPQKYKDF